jgi:hypothetical protein
LEAFHASKSFIFTTTYPQGFEKNWYAHKVQYDVITNCICADLFSELDMSPLQKEFPGPELQVDYARFNTAKNSPQEINLYLNELRRNNSKLVHSFRHDDLYSWSNPKFSKPEKLKQIKQEVLDYWGEGNLTVDGVLFALKSRMFLDKFQELLKYVVLSASFLKVSHDDFLQRTTSRKSRIYSVGKLHKLSQ